MNNEDVRTEYTAVDRTELLGWMDNKRKLRKTKEKLCKLITCKKWP